MTSDDTRSHRSMLSNSLGMAISCAILIFAAGASAATLARAPDMEFLHILGLVAALAVLGALAVGLMVRPFLRLSGIVCRLADGATVEPVPYCHRSDTVGAIARAVRTLSQKSAENDRDAATAQPRSAAFEHAATPMIVVDRDTRILGLNAAMDRMLRENQTALRANWPETPVEAPVGQRLPFITQALEQAGKGPGQREVTFGWESTSFAVRINSVTSDAGEPIGSVLEWRDITDEETRENVVEALCMHYPVAEYRADGILESANLPFRSLLAQGSADPQGTSLTDYFSSSASAEPTPREILAGAQAGRSVQGQMTRVDSNGQEICTESIFVPVTNANGRLRKIIEISSEIAAGTVDESAIEDARTLAAIDACTATYDLTPDGKIARANDVLLALLGYQQEDLIGQPHESILTAETCGTPEYSTFLSRLRNGETQEGIWHHQARDGSEIFLHTLFCPIQATDRDVQRTVAFSTDVTANEQERLRRVTELRAKDKGKAEIVAAISAGLDALAAGELTVRIDTPFTEEYEQLRNNFNDAVMRLRAVMQEVVLKSHGIRGGAAQISQSTGDLASRTESQASSLEQTAAAIEQLTSSVRSSADRAGVAESGSGKAQQDAAAGELVVRDTIAAMNEIDQSSERISEIIGVIEDIAFQTNLLALNAGVEAARAGDAGRGFAVVASEVRALAQRCSDAAREIKELISESGEQVKRGVDLVGRTGAALEDINASVVEITALVSGISTSMKEQAIGLSEINTAVSNLDEVTQQNAAMVEETTAASQDLTSDAQELASLVSRFRIDTSDSDQQAWRDAEIEEQSRSRPSGEPARRQRVLAAPKGATGVASGGAAEAIDEGWEEF